MGKKRDRLDVLKAFLDELEWSPTKRYVELLREQDELLSLGTVDVDLPQIVDRRFLCDARRCIQWNDEDEPLVDRSCCCRYEVPVTGRDRRRLLEKLPVVREHLPEGHRLVDPEQTPFELDDAFGHDLISDNPLGGCQFNHYEGGRCRCLLHSTALAHDENPCAWKPLACSLWPLAVISYTDDGPERFLLTVYCEATSELFDNTDDEPFACLADQSEEYPRLYRSEQAVLRYLFGDRFYERLNKAAETWLAAER